MCDLEVDLGRGGRAVSAKPSSCFAAERVALADLAGEGLVEIEGDRIRLTDLGRPLMRVVAAVFDRYLDPMSGRHARAV